MKYPISSKKKEENDQLTNKNPISCQERDRKVHIKAVHFGFKVKCDICGKEFNRASEMRRHTKQIHPDELTERMLENEQDQDTESIV